jgi:energy-coupling factor transporter ATP-binding protein EcfA2
MNELLHKTIQSTHSLFVFLSYSHDNLSCVERLQADLLAHDIAVWVDHKDIEPGTPDWEEAVRVAIRAASAVIFIASPDARASRNVKDELRIAEMYHRPIYPLWVVGDDWREAAPIGWGGAQYLDARDEHYSQAVGELVMMLNRARAPLETQHPQTQQDSSLIDEPRNPYKGLRAFAREDAYDFFGRSHLVEELVQAIEPMLPLGSQAALASSRFLTVLGPSGSGKSSVVMAGLLPQLQAGRLPGSQEWIYLKPMKPGQQPIELLALTLSEHFPARSLLSIREDLEGNTSRGLHLLLSSLATGSKTRTVLVIDQFEEVFTQTILEEERRRFLDLLLTASTEPHGSNIIVVTLRADFYDRPLHYPDLGRLIEAHHVTMFPMETRDLRAVIEKPAQLPDVQLIFEEDLVGDLLFDVQGQPGALPLLEFTLDQLYRRRSGRYLTRQAYQDIGGVKGALAKHAEGIYTFLPSEDHRRLARALFLRLIDLGTVDQDATRRRALLSELVLSDLKETKTLAEVLATFTQTRLLTTNSFASTSTVEISHETLIWAWARLTAWLHGAYEDIRLQRAISEDALQWQRHEQAVDRLYQGTQLTEALAWRARNIPSQTEEFFLQVSATEHERQQSAERQREEQERRRQKQYTRRVVVGGLAAAAALIAGTATVSKLLLPGNTLPSPYTYLGHTAAVNSVAWSPDGKRLASAGDDNTVQVWSASIGTVLLTYEGHSSSVNSVGWSPDGKCLASAGSDNTVQVWQASTGTALLTYNRHRDSVLSVAWSPDGKHLASAG